MLDVLSGMGSAFVEVGEDQNLFLSKKEINDSLLKSRGYRRGESFRIQEIIRSSQPLIIQAKREGIGSKNPQGTTRISLPGRFWVFLPKDARLGISRRVEDTKEGQRLRNIAKELKEQNEGLIARTAAQGTSRKDLERDFNFLLGTWKGIEERSFKVSPPTLLYEGMDLIENTIRDRLLDDVSEVIVDSKEIFEEILDFLGYMRMGKFKDRIRLYDKETPLFDHYSVEKELNENMKREVKLECGGSLIIDETEALTSIDVNTGGDVQHRNQSRAILNTNLEAAKEIPRQLRLRKISGIIIIDFVDMTKKSFERKVIEKLEEELKKDRVPADFIDMTELGLVEITRKRKGESLTEMLSD